MPGHWRVNGESQFVMDWRNLSTAGIRRFHADEGRGWCLRRANRRPDDAGKPKLACDFAGLPLAVICPVELEVLLSHWRDDAAALTQAGVAGRLIPAKGLPHTFWCALQISGAAAGTFEDFAPEPDRLLRV